LSNSLNLKWIVVASLAVSAVAVRAEDWPKWRGPAGDGIVRENGLMTEWPAAGPTKVWSVPVGPGHASPVVSEGKVYLYTRDEDKNSELLTAYEAATGKQLWQQTNPGGFSGEPDPSWFGTRATPIVEAGKIYTYGGDGQLTCRELTEGKEIWSLNVLKETKANRIHWGSSSSPLIVGDALYVQGGGGAAAPVAVAVDKAGGKILWQSEAKGLVASKKGAKYGAGAGYAAPILAEVAGKKEIIVFGGLAVYGMDPATGKTIWQEEWATDYDVNASTPIYKEPNLFVTSGYGHGCMMLELSPAGAKKLWESKAMASKFSPVILDRDYLYGNSAGALKCLHWPDGKPAWELSKTKSESLGEGGTVVRFGDCLILLGERGKLTLGKATPEGFTKVSGVAKIVDGKANVWATPTISNGRLYVKGLEELLCLDISGK
jgi:outer membrane protein assembly factor BamB